MLTFISWYSDQEKAYYFLLKFILIRGRKKRELNVKQFKCLKYKVYNGLTIGCPSMQIIIVLSISF